MALRISKIILKAESQVKNVFKTHSKKLPLPTQGLKKQYHTWGATKGYSSKIN